MFSKLETYYAKLATRSGQFPHVELRHDGFGDTRVGSQGSFLGQRSDEKMRLEARLAILR
jgi:hypothetical protein